MLPAFLPGKVRYGAQTLTPYLELIESRSQNPVQVWQQNLADGPEDVSTLYRWFRRLKTSLTTLLPLLSEKLIELAPNSEIEPYQTAVLKTSGELTTLALCQLSFWLAQQILTVSGQLLEQTPHLSIIAFLNYLYWQKTGRCLLSPPAKAPP